MSLPRPCGTYGPIQKPMSIRNVQANAILECVQQVIIAMLCTSELDMSETVTAQDVQDFLTDAS